MVNAVGFLFFDLVKIWTPIAGKLMVWSPFIYVVCVCESAIKVNMDSIWRIWGNLEPIC